MPYENRTHRPPRGQSNQHLYRPEEARIQPGQSCVYRLHGFAGLLYVGATQHPHRRWSQHRLQKPWWHEVWRIEQTVVPSHGVALQLEDDAIRTERPLYNRTGPAVAERKFVQRRGFPALMEALSSGLGMPR